MAVDRHKKIELYIFVLEYDKTNSVLSNVPKVCDFLFGLSGSLRVEATKVKFPKDAPPEYVVHEYGGGSIRKRLIAIFRLIAIVSRIPKTKIRDVAVFHYMNHKSVIWPGVLFRFLGCYQVLWYAHASKPLSLRVSAKIVDHIFTSARSAFPLRSNKVTEIGQLVKTSDFQFSTTSESEKIKGLVSVGRIASSKNLAKAIRLVSLFPDHLNSLTLIGPISEAEYLEELKSLARIYNVDIFLTGEVPNENLSQVLSMYSFYFNGTDEAVDKAVIEAALVGCIVLSENVNTLRLTGMDAFWENSDVQPQHDVFNQMRILGLLSDSELSNLRIKISNSTKERNSLETNLLLIYNHIREGRFSKQKQSS